jgi:prolyl-tRNA editing enzyme YbaK/EbsC (Cys-tRNA(Pro) deacylase)
MSLESVRAFFANHAPEIEVIVTAQSSATVALAAAAHGVRPEQIAKTICLNATDMTMLIVTSGTARLDNRKFKDRFRGKARMLDAEQVLAATSHPVGGVCPFGLPAPLPVYCDVSLKQFNEVVPAAGATNAAVRLSPDRLAALTGAEWIDVCQAHAAGSGAQEPGAS